MAASHPVAQEPSATPAHEMKGTPPGAVLGWVLSIFTFVGLVSTLIVSANLSPGACAETWAPTLKAELTAYGADEGRMPPVDGLATYLARGETDAYAQLVGAFLGDGAQVLRVVDYKGEVKTGDVVAYCEELSTLRKVMRWRAPVVVKVGEGVTTASSSELTELPVAETTRLLLPPRAEDMGTGDEGKASKEMRTFLQEVMSRISQPCGDAARQNADGAYQRAHRNLLRNRAMAAYQGFRQACESCPSCDCLRGVALARAREGAMADARAAMRAHEKCLGTGE
ncbi:MAG: hypothetical protein AB2A00_18615 [Myxococcota bacterium]